MFLHELQVLAHEAGALFILDEVLSGFRVAPGGAQQLYGLRPDMTTLAKVLCGGLPGGAVVGRPDVMELLNFEATHRSGRAKVLHQGTFTANPVSMAAGIAMLEAIATENLCGNANRLGALMREGLNRVLTEETVPMAFYGSFSAFHLFANPRSRDIDPNAFDPDLYGFEEYLERPQPLLRALRMALNNHGIDVNTKCSGLLSGVHTETDVEETANAFRRAFRSMKADGFW
jgi:glutamate-1-semialdehyde 2,1-aminomutase